MVEMQDFIVLTLAQVRELLADVDAKVEEAFQHGIAVGRGDAAEGAYNAGFNDGEAQGFEQGFNDGVADGYDEGYEDGYAEGYGDGFDQKQPRVFG
jgi:flagellar biosynthesis/type III secretory pathway protein FliH